ncbi:nuclear receptor 2C2-associated protein-like protein [Cladochytrium replicatum]|nr:nuclear receptor 2C2-associated protein-like protein [Cladochytrium replicatum]
MSSMLNRPEQFSVRVSSVLNRDVKNYGKQYLTDQSEETCWNSDKGQTQWIQIQFTAAVHPPTSIAMTFQGGFSAAEGELLAGNRTDEWVSLKNFYPNDVNTPQEFAVEPRYADQQFSVYRIVLSTSTDLYGRVIVYNLDLKQS